MQHFSSSSSALTPGRSGHTLQIVFIQQWVTGKQNRQCLRFHPVGASQSKTRTAVLSDSDSVSCTALHFSYPGCVLALLCLICLNVFIVMCSWCFLFRQSCLICSAALLSLQFRRCQREECCCKLRCVSCLLHSTPPTHKDCLSGWGPSPTYSSRQKSAFPEFQWRGNAGGPYLWKRCRAGWTAAASAAAVLSQAGGRGEVSTAVFTHRLLYLLERGAHKALIAH